MIDASGIARMFVHFVVSNCHVQAGIATIRQIGTLKSVVCRDSKKPMYWQRYDQSAAAQPHDEL